MFSQTYKWLHLSRRVSSAGTTISGTVNKFLPRSTQDVASPESWLSFSGQSTWMPCSSGNFTPPMVKLRSFSALTIRRQKVVILGAGYAGTAAASRLDKWFKERVELTLVDSRDVMLHKFGAVRGIVYGDKFTHRLVIPQDKLMQYGKVVHGQVETVTDAKVIFRDGKELEYDYLVAATGSRNKLAEPPSNITSADGIMAHWNRMAEEIKKAQKITLIGGGPVSVELAGEIRDRYGDGKQVNIITSENSVLWNNPPFVASFYRKINEQLKNLGVTVFTGERVEVPFDTDNPLLVGERNIPLIDGQAVESDLVINGTGSVLNTSMYPDSWKCEKGKLRVQSTLQVSGKDNVFAVGDINNVLETKLGVLASFQAIVAAKNIVRLEEKKALKTYKPSKPVMLLPIGRELGAVAFPWFSLGPFFPRMVKGKNVFVDFQWKNMNQRSSLQPELK
mmetsp:Transcript_14857/g.17998  ORF Transcript_14857/g.17998 Transcript_14857/m.17998 type:complete len:449 (+) Transcript_14857:3-1349(+)